MCREKDSGRKYNHNMEIINTSAFEKLKIRAVDVNKLATQLIYKINPENIKIDDLKTGYFIRTNEIKNNLYIILDYETILKIDKDFYCHPSAKNELRFVQPCDDNYIIFVASTYRNHWPKLGTYNTEYSVNCVYETNFDISKIHDSDNFRFYFDTYVSKINKL